MDKREVVRKSTEWLCIQCGRSLGNIFGGEYYPSIPGENLRTSGPNLVATCPDCKTMKTFYTADPVVRAVYQLVNAISEVAAKSMVEQVSRAINEQMRNSIPPKSK